MERIVVGIDGSDNARAALQFAIREAALRGATIDAVKVWHRPYGAGGADVWTLPMPVIDVESMAAAHRQDLDEIIAAAERGDVVVHPLVLEGSATQCLLDAAKGAAMLVVGSRGHGGFFGLLLGSVSHQVAAHAPCPVVIVPGDEQ